MSDISGGQELIGPFVVDIDNEQQNLQDAFDVAKNTFEYLRDSHCVEENHIRVFFTGRKGFNLEVLPKALAIRGCLEDCITQSADKLDLIIDHLRQREEWRTSNQVSSNETVIDRIYGNRTFGYGLRHFWVRLHGSWNEWITPAGVRSRMKVHLTSDELRRLSISDIVARSEI